MSKGSLSLPDGFLKMESVPFQVTVAIASRHLDSTQNSTQHWMSAGQEKAVL
jgi:hypothetical protein